MNQELRALSSARLSLTRSHEGRLDLSPARVLATESGKALLASLSNTLRGLYGELRWYEVYLADESDTLVPVARLGDGPASLGALPAQWPSSLSSGRSRRAAVALMLPARPGKSRDSLMGALLLDGRAVLGLIVIEASPVAGFAGSDLEVLEGVAELFSLSLCHLRSRERAHVQACVDLDRKSAIGVQRQLMSTSLPANSGVIVDARYQPALDVGGDFYELVHLADGSIGGAIGDVSGKGVSAALIMARVSSDLRRALRSGTSPSTVLEAVNADLSGLDSETFVTASCIRLDVRRRKLTVANAGHLPLLVRRVGGEVVTFGSPSGTPLGIMECGYSDEEIDLEPLDIVLLMTDGLLDAPDWPSDPAGLELLLGAVRSAPHDLQAVNARILEAANLTKGTRPLDDMTLVALQLAS
jgi:hypothetical protein